MNDEGKSAPPGFRAEGRERFTTGNWPVKYAAESRLDEGLDADATCIDDTIYATCRRVLAGVEACGPIIGLGGLINDVGVVRRGSIFGDSQSSVSASYMNCGATMVEIGMSRCSIKPREGLALQVEIHQRRKAKCQIGARKLRPIRLNQLRMCVGCILVQRACFAEVHVRIDETRDKEAVVAVDSFRMRAGSEIGANLRNPAGANDDNSVTQRKLALWRDKCHILDHNSAIHDLGRDGSTRRLSPLRPGESGH